MHIFIKILISHVKHWLLIRPIDWLLIILFYFIYVYLLISLEISIANLLNAEILFVLIHYNSLFMFIKDSFIISNLAII